jgi:hypothetical protein
MDDRPVVYRVDPQITSRELDELFAASWCRQEPRAWTPVLKRSLVYLCAYQERNLVGFINVAWDGVRPRFRPRYHSPSGDAAASDAG